MLTKCGKTWKSLKKSWGRGWEWKRECLGDEQVRTNRERSKKWEKDRDGSIYRPFSNARQLRYREVKVGVEELVFDSWGIEQVSSNKEYDSRTEARSIHQVSRSYRGGRSFLDRSTRYRGGVETALRKRQRSSTDSKVSRRCRASVEPTFQNCFSRGEKHRYECNPTYNSINDPINTKISQSKKFWAQGSPKHTHTH